MIVPATSVEASIYNPELRVTRPPPQHAAQNQAHYPDAEPLMLATPKAVRSERDAQRDEQHGDADEDMFDQDFSHRCGAA